MERANYLSNDQIQEIIKMYPDTPTSEIAKIFKKSVAHIYKTAQRYGIKKSLEFMNSASSGRILKGQRRSECTEWKKGHIPATKGKKQSDFIKTKEGYERVYVNRWKKGHKPHTTKYDGCITLRRVRLKNDNIIPYYFIRVSENKWEFYHRYLWTQINGTIPPGFNIVFKDGNTQNCNISNLECITNAELALRNSIHNFPENVKDLIYLKSSLKKVIKNHVSD